MDHHLPTEDRPWPRRIRRGRGVLAAGLVLCVILTVSCLGSNQLPTGTEEELWDLARKDQTIRNLEAYITQYPNGRRALEVKRALKMLWGEAVKELTPEDMKEMTVKIYTARGKGGILEFKFLPDQAPESCRGFIRLAQSRYYDGLIFHRVIRDRLIQTGCPKGTGESQPGYAVKFEGDGSVHREGSVGLARAVDDLNSGGGQFYITLVPVPKLDGRYAVFGQVTQGLDVAKIVSREAADPNEKPLVDQVIFRVVIEGLKPPS